MHIYTPGRGNLWQPYSVGTDWLGSSFAEKAAGVWVSSKLSMSQQPALEVKMASSVLVCY